MNLNMRSLGYAVGILYHFEEVIDVQTERDLCGSAGVQLMLTKEERACWCT